MARDERINVKNIDAAGDNLRNERIDDGIPDQSTEPVGGRDHQPLVTPAINEEVPLEISRG